MVRLATVNDAEQLESLNIEFNGKDEATLEHIKESLLNNQQEIVIVDDENGVLTGFVCIQLKKSFCYDDFTPEITEVFVKPQYREKGIASEMIAFAEDYCGRLYPLHKYELLTGKNNIIARSLYGKLGYKEDGEIHLSKRIK
ncbi:MAG: GNAT family N-acetyltransferase [Lachnospiraceae bacterium]|nr:GNAT family N-acetyltransferase [Lachnospiraceae bacterium]